MEIDKRHEGIALHVGRILGAVVCAQWVAEFVVGDWMGRICAATALAVYVAQSVQIVKQQRLLDEADDILASIAAMGADECGEEED